MTARPARSVREADTERRLDIGTWPELDSVRFMLRTIGSGEAIGGPFYFGRAFDLPPFFTFSAVAQTLGIGSGPQLTVGVAEWILDEQGMYVGANMWFQLGHIEPCRPPAVYGTQVLADPGFEGGYVRGPNNGELPILTTASPSSLPDRQIVWPSTYPNVVEELESGSDLSVKYPWVQRDIIQGAGGDSTNTWRDDHSSTHGGDHSVSHDFAPIADAFSGSPRLYPVGVASCTVDKPPGQPFGVGSQFGWNIKPGEQITLSAWARTSSVTTLSRIAIGCVFFAQFRDLSEATGPGSDPPLVFSFPDTAWHFVTRNIFAPPVPGDLDFLVNLAQPYIVARRGTFPTEFFGKVYVDDVRLTLLGGTSGPGFTETSDTDFQVALRFLGQTLKGYSNIHPARSVEAPTQVVLT